MIIIQQMLQDNHKFQLQVNLLMVLLYYQLRFLLLELVNLNLRELYKDYIHLFILIIIRMVWFLIKYYLFIIQQLNNLDLKLMILN